MYIQISGNSQELPGVTYTKNGFGIMNDGLHIMSSRRVAKRLQHHSHTETTTGAGCETLPACQMGLALLNRMCFVFLGMARDSASLSFSDAARKDLSSRES